MLRKIEKINFECEKERYLPKNRIWFFNVTCFEEILVFNNYYKPIILSYVSNEFKYAVQCEYSFKNEINKMVQICVSQSFGDCIIYCHNFLEYGSFLILDTLTAKIPAESINLLEKDNTIYEIKVLIDKGNILIRDSYLLIPSSLDTVSETLCRNYKREEYISVDKVYKTYKTNPDKVILSQYCNDCLILEEGFKNLRNIFLKIYSIDIVTEGYGFYFLIQKK